MAIVTPFNLTEPFSTDTFNSRINEINTNILRNATKELYGLDEASGPDDAFAKIAPYTQHWWKRYAKATKYKPVLGSGGTSSDVIKIAYQGDRTISYSSTVIGNSDGTISLLNPRTVTISAGTSFSTTHQNLLKGKYITNCYENPSNIYYSKYAPSGRTMGDGASVTELNYAYLVTVEAYEDWADAFDYVQSSSETIYPKDGEQGGYLYKYIGVPIEAGVSSIRVATGSYTGTGTYGSNNPNSLTFDFEPKLLLIFEIITAGISGNGYVAMMTPGSPCYWIGDEGLNGSNNVFWTKNTVSWFNNVNITNGIDVDYCIKYQLNQIDVTYNYIAIG